MFSSIGGQPRSSIAALDAVTGTATGWDPGPLPLEGFSARVETLALSGSHLYVGGNFSSIGGHPRVGLAAVDTATGLFTPAVDGPNPQLSGNRNNIGDVWVVATHTPPGEKALRARAHLLVTVPLYIRYDRLEGSK